MKTTLLILSLITGLSAEARQYPGVEILMGAELNSDSVKIQVHSGGCTWKNSFIVRKSNDSRENKTQLTFVRVIPDFCEEYLPEGRILSYSFKEIKISQTQNLSIANPFESPVNR